MRAVVVLVALAASCADTVISGDDDERSCARNSECVIVSVGDVCGACLAELVAVHESDVDVHIAHINARAEQCAPWDERNHVECTVPLPQHRPVCVDGVCLLGSDPDCAFDDRLCHGLD